MSRFAQGYRIAFKFSSLVALCASFAALAFVGCLDTVIDESFKYETEEPLAPVITYSDALEDTINGQYRLNVNSTGGPVTHYSITPALSFFVASFETTTGRISYSIPSGTPEWETYRVIAVGPGGTDTAEVSIPVPNDFGPTTLSHIVLSIRLNAVPEPPLAKTAALRMDRLIITLTSNSASDSVIRDTIVASENVNGVLTVATATPQQILKSYTVKPLRTWTIEVKTLDAAGETMHHGTAVAENVIIAETKPVSMTLTNRFQPMVARFRLPDTLRSSDPLVTAKQALFFKRLVMVVNGDTVADSSASGWFPSSPLVSALEFDHARADTAHTVAFYVYAGSLGSWPISAPVYRGQFSIPLPESTYTLTLPYSGPGSVWDPNVDPSNPSGQLPGLVVEYGATGGLIISPPIPPNPLPKR
jgi:hypothetical protein